ncbi:MAG: phosphonate C-P lyase system protein PhnG [Thermodesulfobacteriota bacterium]|nr:phosphonate C-P lyase system protein PhnG [Thermodesulfobacteriota bacterium]
MNRDKLIFYLQRAEPEEISILCQQIRQQADIRIIQQPTEQTLMLPLVDPVNQGSFYGGEVLVTSAIVRVNEVDGWSMIMDDQSELACNIAILDGAFTACIEKKAIKSLAAKGREHHEQDLRDTESQVSATRVSFDLM